MVVLVAQAAHRLAGHLTWPGFGEFTVVFTLVWIAWASGSLHHELHGHEDARARSTFLLQILVLAAMGAFIPQAAGARGAAFAVAAAVLFLVLAGLWLLAARGDRPEYRRPSRLFVAGTAAFAVLLAGTAFLPASARVPAWGLLDAAYLAGFAAVILRAAPAPAAAPPPPLRGCCARVRPSCWPRRCCSPRACRRGFVTAACTGRSPASAPSWPRCASASAPPGRRRSSSAWRSSSCSASPGDTPSPAAWPIRPNHPPGNRLLKLRVPPGHGSMSSSGGRRAVG